ncbi:hypothetical protein Efla_001250 [Eimeria flavescens]
MLSSSAATGAAGPRHTETNGAGAQQQHEPLQQQHGWQRPSEQNRSVFSMKGGRCAQQQQQQHPQQRQAWIGVRTWAARAAAVAALGLICCCTGVAAASSGVQTSVGGLNASPPPQSMAVTRHLQDARPHPRLLLLGASPAAGQQERFVSLLQEDKPGASAPDQPRLQAALAPLLRHLPGRLRPPAAQQQPDPQLREEGLSLATAMPLCDLSFEALAPKLGGGTYGVVHPLKEGSPPCKAVAAAATKRTRFAVKIFRLRGLASLMAAAEEGQQELSAADKAALPKATSELKSVNLKCEATLGALKPVLVGDELALLQALQAEALLSAEVFLKNFAAIRAAIHTKCFLDELEETGLIFRQINRSLKDLDREAWQHLQSASQEQRVSEFAALGRQLFHWSLPVARALVKDKNGRLHWGILVKLFDGDMEPQANRNADGSALDGWEAGPRNAVLKGLFGSRASLLDISAKAVQPFVFMHNFFFFGHFDIKPANLLYSKRDAQRGIAVELAAGDFGMATMLGQRTLMRGTVAFMAPEIERPKRQATPPPRVMAEAAHDVFALGLTLSQFWTVSSFCGVSYPWVERCITPHLEQGATFSFESMASTTAAELYTPQVKIHLNRCLRLGGAVEKLYLPQMPNLHKLKIAQMTETDPRIRISISNAFAFFKVAQALEGVLATAGDREKRQLAVAEETSLLRLCLSKAKLKAIDVQGQQRQAHAHQALRALQDLASFGPVRRAASVAASPVALETAWSLQAPAVATGEETEKAKQELQAELEWEKFRQEATPKGRNYEDHVDAVLGLDLPGLETHTAAAAVVSAVEAASVAIAKAVQAYIQQELEYEPNTQLLEETPEPAAYEFIFKALGVDATRNTELLSYIKERLFVSFVSWASADRWVRLAVRRCVAASNPMLSVHLKYAAGEAVAEEEAAAFRQCIWQHLEAAALETHHGLPWGVSTALRDYGASEAQVSAFLKEALIKPLAQTAWSTDNARKLLLLQVRRAVSRLDPAFLPGGLNLRGVYAAILKEMHKDRFVPLPFGLWQERHEYTEAMYGLSLQQFRETVVFTATREALRRKAEEILNRMQPQERAAVTAASLRKEIPEQLTHSKRYAATEEAGEALLNQTIEEALLKAQTATRESLVSLRVTVNGALFRSPETNKQKGRPAAKTLKIHPNTTALDFNQHFTRVLQNSLAPGCTRYTAVLKQKTDSGSYEAVDTPESLDKPSWQNAKLRIFAVPPEAGSNLRHLVSVQKP